MKKETKIIILIFLVALLIRISFVFITPIKIWDETVYANLGYDLSKSALDYSFTNGWSDYVPDGSWPKAGFRAPLLPYTLSILYFLKLNFLIQFLIPLFGALSITLIYLIGKEMFSQKVGIYSAILLTLVPLHVFYSSKILTDVFSTFFALLVILVFWKGFEKDNKNWKLLFGPVLALALLSRYTLLWLIPLFPIYLLIKNKSLRFAKDKHLWYSILLFFIFLVPWFIYGIVQYHNALGAFIHGFKASSYWGGVQHWSFYFQHWLEALSISGILVILSLAYIIYYKKYKINEISFVLIWIFFFLGMASLMPHKEERFILPLIPGICLINAYLLEKAKKYALIFIIIVILISSHTLLSNYNNEKSDNYNQENICFVKAAKFLENAERDSIIITDQSPISYYYNQRETHFYPNPHTLSSLDNLIANYYMGGSVYILYTDLEMPLTIEENIKYKEAFDFNFQTVFKCLNHSSVYKYKQNGSN